MKKIIGYMIVAASFFSLSGCDILQQGLGALNFTNCEYSYNSLSNLTVSGINLSKGFSGLSATNILSLTQLFTGNITSLPLNFTVNMNVKNPNSTAAMMSGLAYTLKIDDTQFTTGSVNQEVNIASGSTAVVPLSIGFDAAQLIKGSAGNSALNIVKNFIGMGSEKTNVSLGIRPSFKVNGKAVQSPVEIPVSFSFGGK